jgi:hypothetical protein
MSKKLYPLIFWLFLSIPAFSQYDYRLFGYISNAETGEPIVGARISLPDWQTETYSNNFGYFSISVPPQDFFVEYTFGGFKTKRDSVYIDEDVQVDVKMNKIEVDESQINDTKKSQSDITNPLSGKIDVPTGLLKELPYLLSEPDLIKGLQSLPGITPGNEFGSNLYIRGGAADQNLTFLDGVPVYNGSHIFGLFSIFQPDITNSIQVYKAGFPARYGGRVSSVLDITSNEGNIKEHYGRGSTSLLIAKLSVHGPLGHNNKTTYSMGIRRTYWDALNIFSSPESTTDIFVVSDYNFKVKHKLTKYDNLIFSIYAGRDKYPANFSDSFTSAKLKINYGNISSILRWNHIFNPKLFCNISASATRYKVKEEYSESYFDSATNKNQKASLDYQNGISDVALNADFEYSATNNHYMHFGIQNTNHFINPGYSSVTIDNSSELISGEKSANFYPEIAVYFEDDYKVSEKIKLNMGLRAVSFINKTYNYNPILLEPRVSGRYILKPTLALKASYSRMHQTVFSLTSQGFFGLPLNYWVPATAEIPAQKSDQINIGFAKELKDGYSLSVDAYYKTIDNILFSREIQSITDNDIDWQSLLEKGKAKNYGLELLVNKHSGYLTGWLGYTLAFANRQFDNLNLGRSFQFSYNRRHTMNLVMNYRLTEWNSLFMNLTLASGRYFTIPGGKYLDIDGNIILDYSSLNNYKGPFFQRLDLGCIFERNNTNRIFEQQAFLTLYNVLLARNPIQIYAEFAPNKTNPANGTYKLMKTSIPFFIPGLTYIIRF